MDTEQEVWLFRLPAGFDANQLQGATMKLACKCKSQEEASGDEFVVDVRRVDCNSEQCQRTKVLGNSAARLTRLVVDAKSEGVKVNVSKVAGYVTVRNNAKPADNVDVRENLLPKRHCVEPVTDILQRVQKRQVEGEVEVKKKKKKKEKSKSSA